MTVTNPVMSWRSACRPGDLSAGFDQPTVHRVGMYVNGGGISVSAVALRRVRRPQPDSMTLKVDFSDPHRDHLSHLNDLIR